MFKFGILSFGIFLWRRADVPGAGGSPARAGLTSTAEINSPDRGLTLDTLLRDILDVLVPVQVVFPKQTIFIKIFE